MSLLFAFAFLQSAPLASPPAIQAPVLRDASIQAPDSPAARQAAGLRFAQLLFPLDRQRALVDRAARVDIRTGLMKNADFAAGELETPGLLDALLEAMMPVIHRGLERQLPDYHLGVAAIYAQHMTVAEIGDAMRFYGSPTGQSLVKKVNDNMSFSTLIDQALVEPEAPIRRSDIDKTRRDAAQQTVKSMSGAEIAATAQGMIGKSWVARLPAVQRDISLFDEKFYNAPDPVFDKELDAAMQVALGDFLAKHEKTNRK